jgi:hypothetical protein
MRELGIEEATNHLSARAAVEFLVDFLDMKVHGMATHPHGIGNFLVHQTV